MSEVNNENQDNLNQQSVNEISEAEALAKFDPYAEEEYSAQCWMSSKNKCLMQFLQ